MESVLSNLDCWDNNAFAAVYVTEIQAVMTGVDILPNRTKKHKKCFAS